MFRLFSQRARPPFRGRRAMSSFDSARDGGALAAAAEARRARLCRSDAADAAAVEICLNNIYLALEELRAGGVGFNVSFSRAPFFLRGDEQNIA
eukprot:gene16981-21942_t